MAEANSGDKYIVAGMSTVLIFSIDGVNLSSPSALEKIEIKVEKKLKDLVDTLKAKHSKFEDPDFGPSEKDEYGAVSFYGNAGSTPDPAGSKYPKPETLRWERPQYADDKFDESKSNKRASADDEEEGEDVESEDDEDDDDDDDDDEYGLSLSNNDAKVWCKKGRLFVDGSSSGDVIQGQLGDCWFLSALAVLGADDAQLEACFWKRSSFKEHGLYVLRFFKDCNVMYVIVDDRLPVKAKDGRLIFAANKDPNELWVPLIEKAYAKLHGCYKSLIGGYTHYGLADMTGFCPRLIVMREGYLGFSEPYSSDDVWGILKRYVSWGSLMGCSIQSNPKEKNKVEADAGKGLHFGHAYSFLGIGEINVDTDISKTGTLKLVKLRNPWGRGEWEGRFGDRSDEREKYDAEIERVFNSSVRAVEKVSQNFNDGTFLMPFDDWMKYYTSLFIAINFPKTWCGKRTQGVFSSEQGGNRDMGTWITNPKFKLRLEQDPSKPTGENEYRQVFVGIYIKDSRLTLGFDYYKDPLYATPITFDIVTEKELKDPNPKLREFVPDGFRYENKQGKIKQPPYNFGTTQVEVFLKVGVDYYIVPSLYKRHQAGTFFLNVYADTPSFHLDGSTVVSEAQKPMVVGSGTDATPLKMSVAQYYEKKEALRERIVSEAQRLNLSINQLQGIFKDCKDNKMSRSAFKRRMMEVGFMLTDFPDDDLVVLDKDNDGTISPQEFMEFYQEGLKFNDVTVAGPPPEKPVDDLLLKSIDLSGELSVKVFNARELRQATSWFNPAPEAQSAPTTASNAKACGVIRYDPVEAKNLRQKAIKERSNLPLPPPPAGDQSSAPPLSRPTTPPRPGSASLDKQTPGKFSVLGSLREGYNDVAGKAHSVVSGMSLTRKEAIQQAGTAAASKLHNDPLLKKAELTRTKHLSSLRIVSQRQKPNANGDVPSTNSSTDVGVLRGKVEGATRKMVIAEDLEAQKLLGLFPNQGDQSKPAPGKSTPGKPTVMRSAKSFGTKALLPVSLSAGPRGDQSLPPGVASPTAAEMPSYKVEDKVYDLWDYLIDCVVTISTSRPRNSSTDKHKLFSSMRRKPLSSKALSALNPSLSPIPPPSTSLTPSKIAKGHVATPKSMRKATGVASVNTIQSKAQQKQSIFDAKDKLSQLQKEQGTIYEEIYRRLVLLPVTSHEEISGERTNQTSALSSQSMVYISSLFKKFDKNLNGFISKDEFRLALKELNVEVTPEDCDIFFNRFRGKTPGNIDWREFLEFFETHIVGSTNKAAPTDTSSLSDQGDQGLVALLASIKNTLYTILLEMASASINSIEKYLEQKPALQFGDKGANDVSDLTPRRQASMISKATLPDNAIFPSLDIAQAKSNAALLQSLGMAHISTGEMERISRVFDYKVSLLMEYVSSPAVDVQEALDQIDLEISREISMRSGMPLTIRPVASTATPSSTVASATTAEAQATKSDAASAVTSGAKADDPITTASVSSTIKIWNSLAPDIHATVSFDDFVKFLSSLLVGSTRKITDNRSAKTKALLGGINVEILTRIVTDTLIHSSWNRGESSKVSQAAGLKSKSTMLSQLSFSGLDAYMRANRMSYIERKLKYLMQLESNISSPNVNVLIHVYVSTKGDELVILANDPLTAEVFKIQLLEDVKHLPHGDKVKAMIIEYKDWEAEARRVGGAYANKIFNADSLYLYNPVDTPAEDKAVGDVISRLRIVRTRTNQSEMILTEDPRFVTQLKSLLDSHANSLPFFYLVNGLNITFEVDEEHLKSKADEKGELDVSSVSLRSFVFVSLRNQKALYSFLTQVKSSMKVVLSTYNGTSRETFSWEEMLAHLTNYRNPFITVQLLPKYISPEKYLYEPTESNKPFTGDDEDSDEEESEEKKDPEKKKRPNWQRGPIDFDGAPYPTWNNKFLFDFDAPKLTSCAVMCTEVVKMKIDDMWKYVMVIVRQGSRHKMTVNGVDKNSKENFYFLTLYDSRSATEYQCGVKPDNPLYKKLYYHKDPVGVPMSSFDAKEFLSILGETADKQQLILGPAITPRLEVQVYNHKDEKTKELLGQCQVSISSVLSGSGVGDKCWATLVHKQDKTTEGSNGASNKVIDINAGEVQIELAFRRSIEIEAEKQAEKELQDKLRRGSVAGSIKGIKGEDEFGEAKGGDELLKEAVKVAVAKEKKGDKYNDSKLKELQKDYENLLMEYRKLKPSSNTTGEVSKDQAVAKAPDAAKLKEERDVALLEADKSRKERAAMEAELKKLNEELVKLTVAAKDTKKDSTAAAIKPDEANAKLMKELEELRKQNEALKAAEQAAKAQVKDLLSKQPATSTSQAPLAAAGGGNESEKLIAQPSLNKKGDATPVVEAKATAAENSKAADKSNVEGKTEPIIAPKPSDEVKVSSTAENKNVAAKNSVQASVASIADEDLVLSRTDFVEAIDQLLSCLLARYTAKNKGTLPTGTQATTVLESFNRLLITYANTEGLVSYKDLISTCAELNLIMDTEIAVRFVQEIGPNQRKLVQVHSVMEFLSREMSQMLKGPKKASKSTQKVTEGSTILPDDKYQANLRAILARFQAKYEKNGKSLAATTQPGVVFDGLQRLLITYATENQVSTKEIVQAFGDKNIEVDTDTANRMVHEVGMGLKKAVQVSDLVDYLNKELVAMLREQRQGSNEPAVEKKRAESSTKTRPQSAAVPSNISKGVASSLEVSKDDSTPAQESKQGKKVKAQDKPSAPGAAPAAASAKPAEEVKDWNKEPLPPKWERRFHAPSNRYVYIDHETKKTQWRHPLDDSKSKSKAGVDLNKTDGKGRVLEEMGSKNKGNRNKDSLSQTAPAGTVKKDLEKDDPESQMDEEEEL